MTTAKSSAAVTHAARQNPMLRAIVARSVPAVMGILNVTPDSFSDGGKFLTPDSALEYAKRMIAEGASILDVGAESTRPYGSQPVSAAEEMRRLRDILPAVATLGIPVSIDTTKSSVAAWALEAGAAFVNDVWGLQHDSDMARVVAERDALIVIMHNRDSVDPSLDIMEDIATFFARSLDIGAKAGISEMNVVLDPGIGFGKTPEQSLTALARLDELRIYGIPLLVGASRKRFISSITPSEPHQRLGGSIAAHILAVQHGAQIVRAHDVAETVQALRVAAAIGNGR